MSTWVHNLSIHGSLKEIHEFIPHLEALGYEKSDRPNNRVEGFYLATHPDILGSKGYNFFQGKEFAGTYDRILNLPQDHNLALALAGMRNDTSVNNIGEWLVGEETNNLYECKGKDRYLVRQVSSLTSNLCVGSIVWASPLLAKKATTDQITLYFEGLPKSGKMDKKIIGYKTPYDLWNGAIKTGDIYQANDADTAYYNKRGLYSMPKEIVETWEPVYEEKKIVKELQINGITFHISKEGIYCISEGKWLHIEDIRDVIREAPFGIRAGTKPLNTGFYFKEDTYTVTPETYKIGCTSGFKREDIKKALNIYNDLNTSK